MDKLTICTPPEDQQCWKETFLKKIRDEYKVIFDGRSCLAVRIIPVQDSDYPLLSLMIEDDGMLFETDCKFSIFWTDELIENLKKAIRYWANYEKENKNESICN